MNSPGAKTRVEVTRSTVSPRAPTPSEPRAKARSRTRRLFLRWAAFAALLVGLAYVAFLASPEQRSRQETTGSLATTGTRLDLPTIPWEGGPRYWRQFAKADAAGWSDPNFFPIVVWFNGISSDAEAQYDASIGINTYMGMAETTPYSLFEKNGMFWIGGKLNETFRSSSKNWVGYFVDDEVDGRFPVDEGLRHLQNSVDSMSDDRFFRYANFTQMVISNDMSPDVAQQYVNGFTDAVSIDMYWYTIPFCDLEPFRGGVYLAPVSQTNCRTASSYGKALNALRERDAADGRLQPLWQFVEILNGGPGEGPFLAHISPDQLQAAVMNSIINEARGVVYFNQSLSGPCRSGSVVRLSQVTEDYCGAAQVNAAMEVNSYIERLAPVINTQSYNYSFGSGLDTMLKIHDGQAYIFAMVDGNSRPGRRSFQLPRGIRGMSVDVLFEDRVLKVDASGTFSDRFDAEYTYHIYKVQQ